MVLLSVRHMNPKVNKKTIKIPTSILFLFFCHKLPSETSLTKNLQYNPKNVQIDSHADQQDEFKYKDKRLSEQMWADECGCYDHDGED